MATLTDAGVRLTYDLVKDFGDQVLLTVGGKELEAPWYERKPFTPQVTWTTAGRPGDSWHICTVDVVDDSGFVYWSVPVHRQFTPGDQLMVDFSGRQ